VLTAVAFQAFDYASKARLLQNQLPVVGLHRDLPGPGEYIVTASISRKVLFGSGLLLLALAFVLDPAFATDGIDPVQVPEPSTFALFAIAGVGAIAASLIRRRKK
jgi:hypothetical protein